MLRADANTYDMFCLENSLSYLGEEDKETNMDKSVNGKPISDEIIENSKLKGIIGKIGGIGADSNEPTRNGRRYPLELWQNVEKSEYFIEGMENRSLIGEADHPQERLDYSVTEGAVVLTKYEIQNDGKVYTEFDILDTIPGRTVKTYFDAGCKLGVSSRGLGEEIMRDGEKIIDPNTYQFYCFDVVAFPAVKSARMELIESTSPKKQKLINSITSEIKNCKSLDEVKFIESISRGVNLYLDEIKEAIEIKKEELDKNKKSFSIAQCDNPEEAAKATKELLDEFEKIGEVNRTDRDKQFMQYLKSQLDKYNSVKTEDIEDLFNKLKEEVDENSGENNKIKISDTKTKSDEDTTDGDEGSGLQVLAEIQEQLNTSINENSTLKLQLEQKNLVIKNLVAKDYIKENKLKEHTNLTKAFVSKQQKLESIVNKVNTLETSNQSLKEQLSNMTSKCEKLQKVNKEFFSIVEGLNAKYVSEIELKESLKDELNSIKRDNTTLKNKTVELNESLHNHKLTESKMVELNENIIILQQENDKLKEENKSIKTESIKQNSVIKILNSEKLSLNKTVNESLDKYISMVCTKYNLKESTLRRLLGENYSMTDIDKVVKELVENNSKINSLPFNYLVPDRHVVVENIGLQDDEGNNDMDNFHFMLESTKQ